MEAVERKRVLDALARVGDPAEGSRMVWDAAQQVEADEKEQALIRILCATVERMGEGSARELLARLGWWMLEEEIGAGADE